MNVQNIFQEIDSLLFLFLIIVVSLELQRRQERPFEGIKYGHRYDQGNDSILLIKGLILNILILMHILEHFDRSGPHGHIHVKKRLLISPDNIATKPLEVVLHHIKIGLDTLFPLADLQLSHNVRVDRVHQSVLMAGLLVEFDAQVQEQELENVLLIVLGQVLELFL